MKNLLVIIVAICLSSFIIPTRVISTSTTITTSDDNGVVINTGGAVTYTLGTVSSGFTCTIVNQGTGSITFSTGIKTDNNNTITVLDKSSSSMSAGVVGNSVRLLFDGTIWRKIWFIT